MNNCGTKHRVMLPTSKLNSSDFQVSRASIFLLPLQERVTPALFKNVMIQIMTITNALVKELWMNGSLNPNEMTDASPPWQPSLWPVGFVIPQPGLFLCCLRALICRNPSRGTFQGVSLTRADLTRLISQ
jgi:hypothetical protein